MDTDEVNESQVEQAQRAYDARAPTYEDSFHPDYSRRLMDLVQPNPGDKVLVLACGTGLESFIAAEQVGATGGVIGVDVSQGMLALARARQARETVLGSRMKFVTGDVTKLDGVDGVGEEGFDLIICSNAFVLFKDPRLVVRRWKKFLKPKGRVIIDITHERNLIAGTVMERAAQRMGIPYSLSRAWIKSRDSFKKVLEGEGYVVERIEDMEKISGRGNQYLGIDEADDQFEYIVNSGFTPKNFIGDTREEARRFFAEEWAKMAVDGKVENVDVLYVYIARPE
ncbi:S-adenosyl-L-methionine-dependent methyltransferase [Plectosphaerella cucumerina]|uniref:S-adenosyl-L-methionine-dependent methyltransferase n=1 Tax=Plectosphaerella cucumerina TaxID=40658 RepID=A0A8K0X8G7_9PEZI|nr:S-adenosyl-L-methionine-dependent methyltransferase [Plectosphaerella cucumerina]